jgi:hypothetical protein
MLMQLEQYDDWDFSVKEELDKHANETSSDGVVMAGKIAVADFVCPTEQLAREFNADYVVWMDTIEEGRFEDTNKMFEKPTDVNYHVNGWFDDTHAQLVKVVTNYMKRQDDIKNDRPEGFTMDNLEIGKVK